MDPPLGTLLEAKLGSERVHGSKKDVFEGTQNTASLQTSFSNENRLFLKVLGEAKTIIPCGMGLKIKVFRNFVFGRLLGPARDRFREAQRSKIEAT